MGTRKSDLQRIIDEQQLKIEKYEKKLKDVIGAYKSLAAEKIALEESMKALTASEETDDLQQTTDVSQDVKETDAEKIANRVEDDLCERASIASSLDTSFSESTGVDASSKGAPLPAADRGSKIAVLRRALATITEEKSKQEKAFTADRRNLLQDVSTMKEQMKQQETEFSKVEALLKQQMQELKANLCQLQCERDCEQTDHAAVLKELQAKVRQSRSQCDSYQKQILTLSSDLKKKEQEPEEGRQLIEQLLEENGRIKSQLDLSEKKLSEMPHVSRMQMELSEIKAQHAEAFHQEQTRSSNLSKELSRLKAESEDRIAALEAKIGELTATLSDYERLRCQDLKKIEQLTSRIHELQQENTTLAKITICRSCHDRPMDDSVSSMVEKLKKLVNDLRHRCESGDSYGAPVDFYEILSLDSPNSDVAHAKCRDEYESLKDEFEKYKLRAQTALKNKSLMKDTDPSDRRELDQLRRIVSDLQRGLAESQRHYASSESTCTELRRTIAQLKEEHTGSLLDSQNQFKQRLADIEAESSKQRERALEILAEKEKELETARVIIRAIRSSSSPPYGCSSAENAASLPRRKPSPVQDHQNTKVSGNSQQDASALPLEHRSSLESVHSFECDSNNFINGDEHSATFNVPNIHLSHELARKEKQIEALKKEIRRLETSTREIEHSSVTNELLQHNTIEKLKEEIRLLESKMSRCQMTGENFEYLKNVLVQYMICDDVAGRAHMLKAIGRVLHLSGKELESIQKHNVRFYTWWHGKSK